MNVGVRYIPLIGWLKEAGFVALLYARAQVSTVPYSSFSLFVTLVLYPRCQQLFQTTWGPILWRRSMS